MYEYFIRNVAVMRRKVDSWVNATHILKVANFDKAQRTRILEKEIQKGIHEKIQGGYGKYQGTWVPLEVARELAFQYRVDDVLQPLFNFQESSTTPPPFAKKVTKAKSTISKSKNNVSESLGSPAAKSISMSNVGSTSETGARKAKKLPTFPTDVSSINPVAKRRGRPSNAAKAAAAAAAQSALASPSRRYQLSGKLTPSTPHLPTKRQKLNITPTPPGHKSGGYDDSMNLSGDSASVSSRSSSPSESLSDIDANMLDSTPRQSASHLADSHEKRRNVSKNPDQSAGDTGSFGTDAPGVYQDNSGNGNILICDNELIAAQYGRKLLDYFMAPENDEIPDYLIHPPEGFNINHVIDDEGHTAFHWACSMGNLKIIVALLEAGANIHAVNLLGQTPLIRTVMFTNSYELRSFSKIVELLRESIFHQDNLQRTVLHHIAESTTPRSKLSSARYYTEIFLAKLSESETMNMIEMFVNRQDAYGDSALHIASRNQARKCVKALQSYHASSDLRNKAGFAPQDYIHEYEANRQRHSTQSQVSNAMPDATPHAASTYGSYPDHGYLQYQYAGGGDSGHTRQNSSPTHAYTHVYSYDPASTPAGEGKTNFPPSSIQVNGRPEKRYAMPLSTPPTQASKAFYDAHIFDNGTGGSAIVNSSGGTALKVTSSEIGRKTVSQYAPLVVEKFGQLARIYDSVMFDKKNDADQVKQLCTHANDDLRATKKQIQELVELNGDDNEAEKKTREAEILVIERIAQLRNVVDRSQARDLAGLVKQEEAKVGKEYQEGLERKNHVSKPDSLDGDAKESKLAFNNSDPLARAMDSTSTLKDEDTELDEDNETAELAFELMELQRRRREHVAEILELWSSSAGGGEKMNQYRRLVAMACGVKINEIDGLLGDIEEVLDELPKSSSIAN